MAIQIDTDGTITLYQGDTGNVTVNGLNAEQNLMVYFAIKDKNRNTVGQELKIASNNATYVVFFLDASLTKLLTVPKNASFETYYYAIKTSEIGSNEEDTMFIAGKTYGEQNLMIVYPEQVEGIL